MRNFGFLNILQVEDKGKPPLGGKSLTKQPKKGFSSILKVELLKSEPLKDFSKNNNLVSLKGNLSSNKNPFKGLLTKKVKIIRQNSNEQNVNIKLIKNRQIFLKISKNSLLKKNKLLETSKLEISKSLSLKVRKITREQLQKLKFKKTFKNKKKNFKGTIYYPVIQLFYNEKVLQPSKKEEALNINNLHSKKALLQYKGGSNHSFLEKFVPLKGREKREKPFDGFGLFNYHPAERDKFLNQLKEKFQQKRVYKLVGAEYNKVKKAFFLKIPLDEQTVLKISSVKNNFFAQITTGAERVNLLIQNLQTLTQQIASLGFSSTVIKVQTTNNGGAGGNFNGKGNSHSGNNKDKNVSNNRWKVENSSGSYTSFSFYL